MDISRLRIDQSKMLASGEEYFKLFEKHLPTGLDSSKTVLVYEICNLSCIKKIASLNPEAKHIVVGSKACNRALKMVLPKCIIIEYLEEFDFKETDMKFDCIVMNPPYQKNLHLKILAEAIKHLNDEKSVCVNLSPVRWLQDPLAKNKKKSDFNKYEDTISKHIQQLDVIDKLSAQAYFPNTVMGMDLGIYVCGKVGGFDYTSLVDKMLVKVLKKQTSHIVFDYDKNDGIRVRFPIISNNGGSGTGRKACLAGFGKLIWFENGKRDGKWWYDWYMHNQYTKTTETIPYSAKFETKEEAENFCKSFDTVFAKVYTHLVKSDVNITPEIVLWLGDAINPRTGLKGYESEWTDDDLYKFFNITPEEQKVIEDTMEKYK